MKEEEKKLWKEKTKGLFNIIRYETFWSYIEFIENENKIYEKQVDRLNNIINELEKDLEEYFKKEYPDRKIENYNLKNCTYDYALVILGKLKELKGE